MSLKIFTVAALLLILEQGSEAAPHDYKESWGYVDVRPDAHMFWWLYYTSDAAGYTNKPLVMWLQGGPGASSTGFGNFLEIGPLTVDQKERPTTWAQNASLLFVDNPVGTGYSYVTDSSAYAKNNRQIALDLVVLLREFLQKLPEFQKVPFYVFSESYGGKMAAEFVLELQKEIENQTISCNLKGVALGDSWISPIDSVNSWAPFLYQTSLVDETGYQQIQSAAKKVQGAIDKGSWSEATGEWGSTEDVVGMVTNGVDFYNILTDDEDEVSLTKQRLNRMKNPKLARLYERHVLRTRDVQDDLDDLMNGAVKEKLGIIPADVTWGDQSLDVFAQLSEDFMKPVTDIVESLLNTTSLSVNIYSGQLDLIVATPGTENWVRKLNWAEIQQFLSADRQPFSTTTTRTAGFVKTFKNFSFYWIMKAGHMIPSDQGEAALDLMKRITGQIQTIKRTNHV